MEITKGEKKNQLRIGITGGIGTGKSTICAIWKVLGYPIFYADDEAKQVMREDEALIVGIKNLFGEQAYLSDGNLNRTHIAEVAFRDQDKLAQLNALVHPATIRRYEHWVKAQQAPLSFKEAALLFETGSYTLSDYNILVIAPMELKIKRIIERDRITKQDVMARMSKQLSDDEKLPLADFVIENDEKRALIPQVLNIEEQLLKNIQI